MPPEPLTRADVLTASEASALLGIPRSTLYDLARRGALPARQIGRRWIFRRSLLDRATLPQSEPESWSTGPAANGTRAGARLTPADRAPAVRSVRSI
jgi:excisionase family DNA binding protein